MIWWIAALTFASGAVYEALAVAWTKATTCGKAGDAATYSILQATVQLLGIGESVLNIHYAPFYIFGFGLGSYVAVRFFHIKSQ